MASRSSSEDEDDQLSKNSLSGRDYSSTDDNDEEHNKNPNTNQEPFDVYDISSDEDDVSLPKKKANVDSSDDSNDSVIIISDNEDEELPSITITKEKSRKRKIAALEEADSESNSDVDHGPHKVEKRPFDQDDDASLPVATT